MNLYSLTNLNNASTVDLLRNSITADMFDKEEFLPNYLYEYKDNPANLFNNLAAGRYTYGRYYVLTDDTNKFVASAGWHPYNNNTALVLTRMLVSPKYRATYVVGKEILPSIIKETKQFEQVWITCNEYNRVIYDWFVRVEEGKAGGLFSNWPDIYRNFKPIGQKTIYYTEQYVIEYKNEYSRLGQIN